MSLDQNDTPPASSDPSQPDIFEQIEADKDGELKKQLSQPEEEKKETPASRKAKKEEEKKEAEKPKDQNEEMEDEEDETPSDASELKKLKADIEKKEKALSDTRKWGNKNAQKVKEALKIANKLVEDAYLDSTEANALLKALSSDPAEKEEEKHVFEESSTPLVNILRLARPELENIRRYTEDEILDKKVQAFDMLLNFATPEEKEDILDQVYALKDDPFKMTKHMLALGQRYYEDVCKDFLEAGGLRQYAEKQNQTIGNLRKKIDKLSKRLQEYEDHDTSPKYRLDELSESRNDNARSDLDPYEQSKLESDAKQRMAVRRR